MKRHHWHGIKMFSHSAPAPTDWFGVFIKVFIGAIFTLVIVSLLLPAFGLTQSRLHCKQAGQTTYDSGWGGYPISLDPRTATYSVGLVETYIPARGEACKIEWRTAE